MTIDYIGVIERESQALAEAARRPGMLAGAVPACPGWTGDGLVRHIGEVQAFWTAAVRAGGARPGQVPGAEPGDRDVLEWYDEVRAGLVKALHEVPAQARLWVWWHDDEADSAVEVARRQAHEAAVHRWDAQSVAGPAAPLAAELAGDGVLEFCQRMLRRWEEATWPGPPGVLRLAATDTGGEWLVRLDPAPTLVPAADGAPVATVRGTASDLDLWLWRREAAVAVDGDAAAVQEFRGWAELS